jgi:hypothetical protein
MVQNGFESLLLFLFHDRIPRILLLCRTLRNGIPRAFCSAEQPEFCRNKPIVLSIPFSAEYFFVGNCQPYSLDYLWAHRKTVTNISSSLKVWSQSSCPPSLGMSFETAVPTEVTGYKRGGEGYSAQIHEGTLHFRKLVKTSMVVGNQELGQFWLMDTLWCLGSIPPPPTKRKTQSFACSFGSWRGSPYGFRIHLFAYLAKTILGMIGWYCRKTAKTCRGVGLFSCSGRTHYSWRSPLQQGIALTSSGRKRARKRRTADVWQERAARAGPYSQQDSNREAGNISGCERGNP